MSVRRSTVVPYVRITEFTGTVVKKNLEDERNQNNNKQMNERVWNRNGTGTGTGTNWYGTVPYLYLLQYR